MAKNEPFLNAQNKAIGSYKKGDHRSFSSKNVFPVKNLIQQKVLIFLIKYASIDSINIDSNK